MIRWNRRKIRAIEYLGGRCMRCGLRGHPILFDFDHRMPSEKRFDWNKLRLHAWKTVLAELDKCDLLCGNCHRLRHINPLLWPDVKDGKLE
jgi:hypothetical protein